MEQVKKTYKRETALGLLAALAALFVWGLIVERADIVDTARYLTTPVFLFATAAFGMDAVAKQFK